MTDAEPKAKKASTKKAPAKKAPTTDACHSPVRAVLPNEIPPTLLRASTRTPDSRRHDLEGHHVGHVRHR